MTAKGIPHYLYRRQMLLGDRQRKPKFNCAAVREHYAKRCTEDDKRARMEAAARRLARVLGL